MNVNKKKGIRAWLLRSLPLLWVAGCLSAAGILLAGGPGKRDSHAVRYVTRSIQDVRVGDYVLAKDPGHAGPPTPHRVLALPRNWTEHIVHVTVEGGGELQATRNHPFYVEGKGWIEARDLHVGDKLRDADGRTVLINELRTEDRQADTYNLTVEGVHTYYVLAGQTPVLVHNIDPVPPWMQQQSRDQDLEEGATPEDLSFWGGEGTVYRVPGAGTPSGRPYIGRSDKFGVRKNFTGDGRNRGLAEEIGKYPAGDKELGRQAEQQAIDDAGGLSKTDNLRNEVRRPPCE